MIDPLLKAFNDDKATQRALLLFIGQTLRTESADRVLGGKPTVGLKEAEEIINRAFRDLARLCTPPRPRKPKTANV